MKAVSLSLLLCLFCLATSVLGQCGTRPPPSRAKRMIVGGFNVTDATKWPWQVLLQDDNEGFCGGTIVSEQWVLTAAHCMEKRLDASRVTVVTGITNENRQKNGTIHPVSEIKIHPEYTVFSEGKDIAILKLTTPIVFDETAAPICLPNPHQFVPDDGNAVATGFGAYNVTDNDADKTLHDGQFREVLVPIVPPADCLYRLGRIPPNVVCASSLTGGIHEGDSGGPLTMRASSGAWYQIGIASYIRREEGGMDGYNFPKVWTDVRKYCPWIKEATNGEAHCEDGEVMLENVKESEIGNGPDNTQAPHTTLRPGSSEESVSKISEVTTEESGTSDEPEISDATTGESETSDKTEISDLTTASTSDDSDTTDETETSDEAILPEVTTEESETSDKQEITDLTTSSDYSDTSDEVETSDEP